MMTPQGSSLTRHKGRIMDFAASVPYLGVVCFALALLSLDLWRRVEQPAFFTFGAAVFSSVFLFLQLSGVFSGFSTAFSGSIFVDSYAAVLSLIILIGTVLTSTLHHRQLDSQRVKASADIDVLLLFAALGGMVMVSAANLIVFFVGFELLSVCVYVLSGLARREKASAEGAMKYFILGAFSSGFLLYGIALIYGATGSFALLDIAQRADANNVMMVVGLGLLLFGLCFKISAAPFHFWAPDVYQGAPTSIAAFMAAVVKTAAFGGFLRIMSVAFGTTSEIWIGFIWTVSVLTMTLGNLMALRQRSLKRLLAYSSISHAGYALMGFVALRGAGGEAAVMYYLLVYSFMTVASFGVVMLVSGNTPNQYGNDDLDSLRGLGWSQPLLGMAMTVAVLSLAGFPPLGGFFGKFYLFSSAIKAGYLGLAIIAALNSVVSLAYYLRILVVMYFSGEKPSSLKLLEDRYLGSNIAISAATVATIILGLFSDRCIRLIQNAVSGLI